MQNQDLTFSEDDKRRIYLLAKKCLRMRHKNVLDTNVLTPTNFHQEKEKFLASKTYNPQFTYKKVTINTITQNLENTHHYLQELHLPADLRKYFVDYLNNIDLVAKTVQAIGTDDFPILTKKLFNVYVPNAHEILQKLPKITFHEEEKMTLHSAPEIAKIFHDYLQTYHELYQYRIYLDTFNDHTIRVGERQLVIGASVTRTKSNVQRLIVHEIESHILQRYNTKMSRNPLVRLIPSGEHEMLSEGLAVFNEVYTKTITQKAYATYFYRLKAVEMLNQSFRDIHSYLTNFVSPYQAFIITARVKRGMKDTAQPGGFPKDAAYLLGYDRINQYVANGGNLPLLYLVRNPEYAKLLKKYSLLHQTEYILPKFLKNKTLMKPMYQMKIIN